MKDIPLLALSILCGYAGYRYSVHPQRIKAAFPDHIVGRSPLILIRGLGILFFLFGATLVYLFLRSLIG